jgi:protocatechuate 3,4-dioxygenase beta subunit
LLRCIDDAVKTVCERDFYLLMNKLTRLLFIFAVILGSSACTSPQQDSADLTTTPGQIIPTKFVVHSRSCQPTLDDGVSPSYKPDAPERTIVGKGHVITGTVLSSADCLPIAKAKLEFWPEVGELGHPDSERATFYTDQQGRYRFECDLPDHIHMRVSASGYRTIGVNSYHPNGQVEGTFDIVLAPEQ